MVDRPIPNLSDNSRMVTRRFSFTREFTDVTRVSLIIVGRPALLSYSGIFYHPKKVCTIYTLTTFYNKDFIH